MAANLPNIFDFNDAREFLSATFHERQKQNGSFSMRLWARKIGFAHPSMLSMILNNKRKLKPALAVKIRKSLDLSPTEQRYFDILVLYQNSETDDERELYANIMNSLNPERQFSEFKLDVLRLITNWQHLTMLEMVHLKDFSSDPRWLACRLGGSVTEAQAEHSFQRLVRLGLIQKNSGGRYERTEKQIYTLNDIPDKAIREVHKQFLEQSIQALEQQDVKEKEFQNYTFCVSKRSIPKAKKMIRDFISNMASALESESGDEIYELGVQFFRLTTETNKSH